MRVYEKNLLSISLAIVAASCLSCADSGRNPRTLVPGTRTPTTAPPSSEGGEGADDSSSDGPSDDAGAEGEDPTVSADCPVGFTENNNFKIESELEFTPTCVRFAFAETNANQADVRFTITIQSGGDGSNAQIIALAWTHPDGLDPLEGQTYKSVPGALLPFRLTYRDSERKSGTDALDAVVTFEKFPKKSGDVFELEFIFSNIFESEPGKKYTFQGVVTGQAANSPK